VSDKAPISHEITKTTPYGLNIRVALPYEVAVERTVEELGKEGFGVLTEVDLRATFKRKLDIAFRPYVILGACNPPLALRALKEEPQIGLLLPCNVVVYATDDPDTTVVAAIDPVVQLGIAGNEQLEPLAKDLRARL
jgi:uncharacterized protein (DUF302 family)